MAESESVQVLLKAANREEFTSDEESSVAIQLCGLLGGLPLALVHVGSYCNTAKITFMQYLERFQTHRVQLMTMQPPLQLDKYSYSTYTTIKLSYSLLDEHSRDLLHLLAFFHSSSIRLDILRTASKYKFKASPEWGLLPRDNQYNNLLDALRRLLIPSDSWSDIYVDSLLHQLQLFSLISLSILNGQKHITMHPLVQSCILDTLSPEAYELHFHMAVLVLSSCSYSKEVAIFRHLSTHIAELESYKKDIHSNDIAAFTYIAIKTGKFQESMTKWEQLRDECGRVNGQEHKSTLHMSHRVGGVFIDCTGSKRQRW
jgi:hypothetical protein